jgi:MFS family permease
VHKVLLDNAIEKRSSFLMIPRHIQHERQAWRIVAVLFVAFAFLWGGTISTPGIFFAPLIREFGWSHARVSSLASAVMLGTIPGSVLAGFLLEKVDTRIPVVAGAALTAGSLLFASRAESYFPLLLFYFFAGFGVAMATLLPAALLVANWFQAKRGIALGLAIAGVSAGAMRMVQVAAAVIRADGWRAAYAALALPVLVIVIPLVLLVVRTRPPDTSVQGLSLEVGRGARVLVPDLDGFNLASAIGTRSFWFIAVGGFLGVGYRPATTAIVLSLTLGLNDVGKWSLDSPLTASEPDCPWRWRSPAWQAEY